MTDLSHERSPSSRFLAGRMLIAMPGIEDPRFERAVVLICTHDAEHAMGVAVNRPIEGLTVPNLLERLGVERQIELPDDSVLLGGPVAPENGFVLHTADYTCADASVVVGEDVALTATREVLTAMAGAGQRPRRSVLMLGYAGWGAGQLEDEIRAGVWLTCDPDESLVFGGDHEHKWTMALAKLGVTAERLSAETGRA
jgi:putative transcriptional regulator